MASANSSLRSVAIGPGATALTAAGEERSSLVRKVSSEALLRAAPWRTFRWYFGQRHYSGSYWSATEGRHVIYESRLELARLLFSDFDRSVHRICAQPFSTC